MTKAKGETEFDLDEDLFDFDEIEREARNEDDIALEDIFASFDDEGVSAMEGASDDELIGVEDVAATPASAPPPPPVASAPSAASPPPAAPAAAAQAHAPAALPTPAVAPGFAPAQPQGHAPAQVAPAHAPAPAVYYAQQPGAPAAASSGLSRGMLLLIATVTTMNALVAFFVLRSAGDMRTEIKDEIGQFAKTAGEIKQEAYLQSASLQHAITPVSAPVASNHPTFDLVRDDIAKGQYAVARQRIYSLLSIVDRLDPDERQKVESRANYLLAQSIHLEALTREATR